MELEIVKAKTGDYGKVRDFYYDLIDHMDLLDYRPGWQKGIYPADDYLLGAIEKGQLFYGLYDGRILTAMIVNDMGNDSYRDGSWKLDLSEGDYLVIHALCVNPKETKKGYAKKMVSFCMDLAKKEGKRAIRLDVLKGNQSAVWLYEAMGFLYCDTLSMFYEDTGWTDFLLYEYEIK